MASSTKSLESRCRNVGNASRQHNPVHHNVNADPIKKRPKRTVVSSKTVSCGWPGKRPRPPRTQRKNGAPDPGRPLRFRLDTIRAPSNPAAIPCNPCCNATPRCHQITNADEMIQNTNDQTGGDDCPKCSEVFMRLGYFCRCIPTDRAVEQV